MSFPQNWKAQYVFKGDERIIVLTHVHGANIRTDPNSSVFSGEGGYGKWAQFRIHLNKNLKTAKFQNITTGKYIRIMPNKVINVGGNGGGYCNFKIHNILNAVKLESVQFPGQYIATGPKKRGFVGGGGKHCQLYAFQNPNNPVPKVINVDDIKKQFVVKQARIRHEAFSLQYQFIQNNVVVIRVPNAKTLYVNNGNLLYGGGVGKLAQFSTILWGNGVVSFKSHVNNGFIRITPQNTVDCRGVKGGGYTKFKVHRIGTQIKLQSLQFPRKFIAHKMGSIVIGAGGNFCLFRCLKNGAGNNNKPNIMVPKVKQQQQVVVIKKESGMGAFQNKYLWIAKNTVIIKSLSTNKTLRVNPGNKGMAGGLGGAGALGQWICYPRGQNKVMFQNINTKKYLRYYRQGLNGVIDVGGSAGGFCEFYAIRSPNSSIIKLQSVKFPKFYVGVNPQNGAVKAGLGGNHCLFTVWKAGGQPNIAVIKPNVAAKIICPKCHGLGYWGTFGACKQVSVHKKIACPCCIGQIKINARRKQCLSCKGLGYTGTFGFCDWHSIHKKGPCFTCNSRCYIIG